MVAWTNEYIKAYPTTDDDALFRRPHSWMPIDKRELYAYFGAVIYIGIMVQPLIEDYWGPYKEGTADFLKGYILKNRFQQLN